MPDDAVVLSQQAKSRIAEMIISGVLRPGQKLREVALAKSLLLSRTPLREALISLEREGFLFFKPNVGFSVKPLSVSEVKELYPIIWSLEILGLKLSFELLRSDISSLRRINEAFSEGLNAPQTAIQEDARFHAHLLYYSQNAYLQEIVNGLRQRLLRYEHRFMSEVSQAKQSVLQHERIIVAIENGNVLEAECALVDNWRSGMHSLIIGLQAIESQNAQKRGAPSLT